MQPTVESFRALARSSPWRWRTLHFTRRGGLRRGGLLGDVEAWVRRPGELVVRLGDGSLEYVAGVPYSTSALTLASRQAGSVDVPASVERPDRDAGVVMRPDGLVAERPSDWYLEHSDPMWENYTWTAMLDPDELSHHVVVDDVRSEELRGRETWRARLVPQPGYAPRCGCCPLLWSEVAAVDEYRDEPERLERFAAEGYPEAHDVGLDVQSGVVVLLDPVGGDSAQRAFELEIHAVDADLDDVFAGRG